MRGRWIFGRLVLWWGGFEGVMGYGGLMDIWWGCLG